jgi:CD109 antigen
VSVEVLANQQMTNLVAFVQGRGNILLSKSFDVPNSKSFNFTFTVTKSMTPQSKLLVYYICEKGEIISDHVEINFGFKLENTVS